MIPIDVGMGWDGLKILTGNMIVIPTTGNMIMNNKYRCKLTV